MALAWSSDEVADFDSLGTPIDTLTDMAVMSGGPGGRLKTIRAEAAALRAELPGIGTPQSVTTCDLVTLPYPTRFGLFRASRALAPFLSITNRMLVIRWLESGAGAAHCCSSPPTSSWAGTRPTSTTCPRRPPASSRALPSASTARFSVTWRRWVFDRTRSTT